MIGYGLNGAMFALTGQYERTGPGVGASPVQWAYGVRMNGRADRPVRFDAAAEHLGGSIEAAKSLMIRAGMEVDLPLSATVRMSAERNPYVVPGAGASDWIYVFGISRAFGLPRLSGGGTRGTVYRDVNGNGKRDGGEPGFAGVMLKRGSEVAVTDNRGSFHLMGNEREPYELDARSLPLGWIAPSTVVSPATRSIGAVALSPIEVELVLDPADSSRVSRAHLIDLVVTLRDSTGRQWMSRRASPSSPRVRRRATGHVHGARRRIGIQRAAPARRGQPRGRDRRRAHRAADPDRHAGAGPEVLQPAAEPAMTRPRLVLASLVAMLVASAARVPSPRANRRTWSRGSGRIARRGSRRWRGRSPGRWSSQSMNCVDLQGVIDVVEVLATGESQHLAGPVSGTVVDSTLVRFEATLGGGSREHFARLSGDSLSGTWIETAVGAGGAGPFAGRRQEEQVMAIASLVRDRCGPPRGHHSSGRGAARLYRRDSARSRSRCRPPTSCE